MKSGIKTLFSIFAVSVLLSSCYINRESEQKKSITVSGTGTIAVNPDTATIDFTVVSAGWSAKQIVTDNDTISNRLVEAVKNTGVNANDIFVSDCTISNPASQYEARRNIRIIVRNISLVSAVIDCKSGASVRLKGIEYSLNDSVSVMRRARSQAVQQTQDAASLIAGASGSKIGEALSIKEEKASCTHGADGKINVTSEVTVSYSLQ